MMRVGKLPSLSPLRRPVSGRRRTLPYSRRKRSPAISPRPKAAAPEILVNDEDMIFDQPPVALPVATMVPKDRGARLAADLRSWFAARWHWFRPRTIPMVVAFVGMLAVIGAATWLRNYARRAPDRIVETQPHDASISLGD
jgi:hypothetical protein